MSLMKGESFEGRWIKDGHTPMERDEGGGSCRSRMLWSLEALFWLQSCVLYLILHSPSPSASARLSSRISILLAIFWRLGDLMIIRILQSGQLRAFCPFCWRRDSCHPLIALVLCRRGTAERRKEGRPFSSLSLSFSFFIRSRETFQISE